MKPSDTIIAEIQKLGYFVGAISCGWIVMKDGKVYARVKKGGNSRDVVVNRLYQKFLKVYNQTKGNPPVIKLKDEDDD